MKAPSESPLAIRGVHLDGRAQLLRFPRILEVIGDLARWGYNTILFEYEDHFPFHGRLKGIAAEDALTPAQVRQIVRRADDLGITIMPLVHCLGHLEYALRVKRFSGLADGGAGNRSASTICPCNPAAAGLFREMVRQVLDLHPDCRYFHMGGDEAAMIADCPRCAARKRAVGISRLLVDHYIDRADWLRAQGPDPVMWCDMPLRHPEALDHLRGHVVIMDWDYWSGTKPAPTPSMIWHDNVKGLDPARPATWPATHRRLFERYIFTAKGRRARPFPYTPFLRDQGFPVIVASAARCYGDSSCVPFPEHVSNVIGAARAAAEQHVLGSVITSWALRRAPWPLTEQSLIAGAMTMRDPGVSRAVIDASFAAEHFGKADPKLARIAELLGAKVWAYLDSFPVWAPKTGRWPGLDYAGRQDHFRKTPTTLKTFRRQLATLKRNLVEAGRLLAKVRPSTARQRERVALWRWAHEVLGHFAAFGPQLLKERGRHDPAELRRFRAEAQRLEARTLKLLGPLYTDHTMLDEQQTRFGIHLDYIDAMLKAAAPR